MSTTSEIAGARPEPYATSEHGACRIPADIGRDRAIDLVLTRAPDLICTASRLVHHPYAAYVYHVRQRAFGRSIDGVAHILVDRCSGGTSTSDPWPEPILVGAAETLDAPPTTVSQADAEDGARQCAVRAALHRRRALIPIEVELISGHPRLYKPNWLLTLQLPDQGGTVTVLVDALTGAYHLLPGGVVPGSATAPT